MKEKKCVKIKLSTLIFIFIIAVLILGMIVMYFYYNTNEYSVDLEKNGEVEISNQNEEELKNKIVGHNICDFDLSFLKEENKKVNKIYSPLSIKIALKMLEEGAKGETKSQIAKYIGEYTPTKYISNSNMVFANAIFVRDSYKIKENYAAILKNKYNAETISDSFSNATSVNNWVSKNTLKLINNLLNDINSNTNFILINALGIDMEWKDKFLLHEDGGEYGRNYQHEKFYWGFPQNVESKKFDNKQNVSGMNVIASINNYNIVKELGEENIKKTVGNEYKKWAKDLTTESWEYEEFFKGDLSDLNIEKNMNEYLSTYITEINKNYHDVSYNTDFSIFVDNNIKCFAKDLKEYNGTTLQYIGIMPISKSLDSYIEDVDATKINEIINNLKDLKTQNFKEGVVTKIVGYIPKFKFEYELNLKNDLKKMKIQDVFESGKANLTNICDENDAYINEAIHKANIEFTQDGIKAAAATMGGGAGAGESFDYLYDVPVEEIDITFDKPYMFLIRDKETGEIWFTGTVYEPILWENEPEKDNLYI